MELSTLRRRVKRQFGDEYDIIIDDQDIIDWCNAGQTEIVRDTNSNDTSVSIPANQFPYSPVDRVTFKRVAVNNRALTETTLSELDKVQADNTLTGTPSYWYYEADRVNLYPSPAVGDVYNVLVTYAKLPTELHYLSPYLKFVGSTIGGSIQYATTAADVAFKKSNLNMIVTIEVTNTTQVFTIASSGTDATGPTTLSWDFQYMGGNNFRLKTSNNAAIVNRDLTLTGATIVSGEKLRLRVTYENTTGTLSFFRINLTTGAETAGGTVVGTVATLNTATSFPISIGTTGVLTPVGGPGPFKLYEFQYSDLITTPYAPVATLDGIIDIQDLPTVDASLFASSSGHTWTLNGNPPILVLSTADLTIPDLYHEDLVSFCLSRAFDKNMNYKAADANMEKFQQGVTQRRNEADSTDNPSYKMVDPYDYDYNLDGSAYY